MQHILYIVNRCDQVKFIMVEAFLAQFVMYS